MIRLQSHIQTLVLGVVFSFALALLETEARAEAVDAGVISRQIMQEMPQIQNEGRKAQQQKALQEEDQRQKAEERAAQTRQLGPGQTTGQDQTLAVPIKVVSVTSSLLSGEIEELLQRRFFGTTAIVRKEVEQAKQEIWAAGVGKKRLLYVALSVSAGTKGKGDSYLIAKVTPITIRNVDVIDDGETPVRTAVLEDIRNTSTEILASGKVVDLAEVDELLLRRLRLNDVRVHASVSPVDDTHIDLKISVKGLPSIGPAWLFQYDNAGDWSFGRDRALVGMNMNNTWVSGDQVSVMGMKTADIGNFDVKDGTYFGRAEYEVPIGEWHMRAVGWLSGLHYHQVKAVPSSTNTNGEALEMGFGLIRPFYVDASSSIETRVDYLEKYTIDRVLETTRSSEKNAHDARFKATFTRQLEHQQELMIGAGFTLGDVDLSADRQVYEQDQASAKANGVFFKAEGEGSWRGRFDPDEPFDFKLKARGQVAPQNLDSMEKFTLGGLNGMRAFGAGEATGDEGYVASGEVGYLALSNLRVLSFYDIGQSWKTVRPWSGIGNHLTYVLQDAGVGVEAALAGFDASLTFAHQIGPNPGLSATGLDADNSKQHYRLWSSLAYRY